MSEKYYTILDTETTGLPKRGSTSALTEENLFLFPDLIEPAFGMFDRDNKRFINMLSTFVPWPNLKPFETKDNFHEENNMRWEDCKDWSKEALPWRSSFMDSVDRSKGIVCYNAQFDYKVIAKAFPKYRTEIPKVFCVSETMRILVGHRISLGEAYKKLHGKTTPFPPHFALSDILTLAEVVIALEENDIELYEEVFQAPGESNA